MAVEQASEPAAETTIGLWQRVQKNKVVQWAVAYLGVALALAQAQELIANAFEWPELVGRAFIALLIIGLPVAVTVAWYHGHRGLKQVSAGELAIAAGLLFIGAVFMTIALRPAGETDAIEAGTVPIPAGVSAPGEPPTEPARPVLPNSVAVLPLDNLTPDPANGFYALSMHAEIISKLTQLKNLNVINRDSVLGYAAPASRPPPERIAADLGVESLLLGTFQFTNGRIRIGMQLVDPLTRRNLWANDYQAEFADSFAVQADIAMNVANALAAEFSEAEQAAIERPLTSSPEAYARYLEAIDPAVGIDRSHTLLDEAIALDPEFAQAHATKAIMYAVSFSTSVQGMGVSADDQDELALRVRQHAERALAFDPTSRFAHGALRTVNLLTWRWSEFRRDLGDSGSDAVYDLWGLAWMGDMADAVRRAEQLLALNPKYASAYVGAGHTFTYAGDFERARTTLRSAVRMAGGVAPFWEILAFSEAASGNADDAFIDLQTAERLFRANPIVGFLPEVAYTYSRIGRPDDARRLFAELEALPDGDSLGAGGWAVAHLAVDNHAEALRWLEVVASKARDHEVDPGFISVMNLKMNYLRDSVLERPEFVDVLERIRGD